MKKEKETITVTCPRCHQKSTIEVKLTSPSLYFGVCPKWEKTGSIIKKSIS